MKADFMDDLETAAGTAAHAYDLRTREGRHDAASTLAASLDYYGTEFNQPFFLMVLDRARPSDEAGIVAAVTEALADYGWKPLVTETKKFVVSSSGNLESMDYDVLMDAGTDEMFGVKGETYPLKVLDMIAELGVEIPDDVRAGFSSDDEEKYVEDVETWLEKHGGRFGLRVVRDNTYNWAWWGPTMVFTLVQAYDRSDAYDPAVLIISTHGGGDPRGNYGAARAYQLDSYADEVPWYDYRLEALLKTDRGEISLESENDEGYHWRVFEDETGTFEKDETITQEKLEEALEFETFKARIW